MFRLKGLKSPSPHQGIQGPGGGEHIPNAHLGTATGHQLCLQRVMVMGGHRDCRNAPGSQSPEAKGKQIGPQMAGKILDESELQEAQRRQRTQFLLGTGPEECRLTGH